MASNFAWGIDVGNRALKAVKLVRDGDQLRVDDFDVIEHETVLSNAGDNQEELIKSALSNFVTRHPGKGGQYAIGVCGQASFARFIKLPPVEPKKIPEIVRFEAIQQIPFPLDDVEWSYQLFQGADSPDVEVGIFAMRKELVNQHIKFFTDVGHERPGRADEPAGGLQRDVSRQPARGHDDDHRPRRREHRPDHLRRRNHLAALDSDRRKQLHRRAGQGVQAEFRQGRGTEAQRRHQQIRPADFPGDAADLCRPGRGDSALDRILRIRASRFAH